MAYETGTAADYQDLLLKLEKFLTTNSELVKAGQQWQVMKDNTAAPYSTDKTVDSDGYSLKRIFVGGGLDGQDKITVPMACKRDTAGTYANVIAWVARAYQRTKDVSGMNTDTASPTKGVYAGTLCCWVNSIPYWFFANGRRFIVVAKVGHRYTSLYAGFFMPSGTDIEYPYPYCVGGTSGQTETPYTAESTSSVRSFFNPQSFYTYTNNYEVSSGVSFSNLTALNPQGSSVQFDNRGGNSADSSYAKGYTYPYHFTMNTVKTADNQYLLLPIELVEFGNQRQVLGWFDGCYHVSGFENSAESIVTVNGQEYICFPSMIQNDTNNWVAIKKA